VYCVLFDALFPLGEIGKGEGFIAEKRKCGKSGNLFQYRRHVAYAKRIRL
jgi:hypothetical protein